MNLLEGEKVECKLSDEIVITNYRLIRYDDFALAQVIPLEDICNIRLGYFRHLKYLTMIEEIFSLLILLFGSVFLLYFGTENLAGEKEDWVSVGMFYAIIFVLFFIFYRRKIFFLSKNGSCIKLKIKDAKKSFNTDSLECFMNIANLIEDLKQKKIKMLFSSSSKYIEE